MQHTASITFDLNKMGYVYDWNVKCWENACTI